MRWCEDDKNASERNEAKEPHPIDMALQIHFQVQVVSCANDIINLHANSSFKFQLALIGNEKKLNFDY